MSKLDDAINTVLQRYLHMTDAELLEMLKDVPTNVPLELFPFGDDGESNSMLTVAQLIAVLQGLNPQAMVMIQDQCGGYHRAVAISVNDQSFVSSYGMEVLAGTVIITQE